MNGELVLNSLGVSRLPGGWRWRRRRSRHHLFNGVTLCTVCTIGKQVGADSTVVKATSVRKRVCRIFQVKRRSQIAILVEILVGKWWILVTIFIGDQCV